MEDFFIEEQVLYQREKDRKNNITWDPPPEPLGGPKTIEEVTKEVC